MNVMNLFLAHQKLMDKQILNIDHVYLEKQVLFSHYFPYEPIKHEQGISINIEHKESMPRLNVSNILIQYVT